MNKLLNKAYFWALKTRDEQCGKVNLGGILLLGVAFIMIGIAIRFAPMMITGFADAYTAANTTAAFADAGLTDVLSFGPTLIILGFIVAVAIVGFLGVKLVGKGE